MKTEKHKTRTQMGCLVALISFSVFLAFTAYPYGVWRFGAAFGTLALVSVFLRVRWFVPFTIAGVYFGMFVLDPAVKGGTIESQMNETVGYIVLGSLVGFVIGVSIDIGRRPHPGQRTSGRAIMADEQTDEREPD